MLVSAFPAVLGVCPYTVLGEMADSSYPLAAMRLM